MITEDQLIREFRAVVENYSPVIGQDLQHCYVKRITTSWGTPPKPLHYLGIYCPESLIANLQARRSILREIAQNMDLGDVVCVNATRLLRDPMSKLRQAEPRFWLELHWLISGNP